MWGFLGALGAGALMAGANIYSQREYGAMSKENMKYQNDLQKEYDIFQLRHIYPEYQNLDYDMAQKYAQNSAQWEIEGLKRAGLNPILGVQNLGSLGTPYSSPSFGTNSVGTGAPARSPELGQAVTTGLQALNASANIKNANTAQETAEANNKTTNELRPELVANAKSDNLVKESQAQINTATANKILEESKLIAANTAKTIRETEIVDRPKGLIAESADWALRRIVDTFKAGKDLFDTYKVTGGFPSESTPSTSHSARDNSDAEKQLLDNAKKMMEQYRRERGHNVE